MLSHIVYAFEAAHRKGDVPRLQDYLPPEARWAVISGREQYDWPSDDQGRSTLELLQYLSYMGTALIPFALSRTEGFDSNAWMAKKTAAEARTAVQTKMIQAMFGSIPQHQGLPAGGAPGAAGIPGAPGAGGMPGGFPGGPPPGTPGR